MLRQNLWAASRDAISRPKSLILFLLQKRYTMGSAFSFFSSLLSILWTWTLLGFAAFVGYQVSQETVLENIPGFDALPDFLRVPLQHQTESTIVFTLAGVISGFLVFFLTSYVWQALQDFLRLSMVSQSLGKAKRDGRLQHAPSGSDNIPTQWGWFYYPLMTRLWREYAETLHQQVSANLPGKTAQVSYRSTIPAETIFSLQSLVDVPMRVEFFRHLPGILTGAGIVSTFAGILLGLSEFNPAVEAQQITYQLKQLFTGITTAFVASFFAIFSAMLVTVIEKLILHWRYAQVTALQHRMDDIFRSGIEPEYLASLVSNGKDGFQQLQMEIGRLAASLAAQQQHPPEIVTSTPVVLPPEFHPMQFNNDQREVTQNLQHAVKEALGEPLLEISRLLQRGMDVQGRRREDGRSSEIQLTSMSERLDVALREFARTMATMRDTMDGSNDTIKSILNRQLDFLERMDARMEDLGISFKQTGEIHAKAEKSASERELASEQKTASLVHDTLETQTLAIRAWNNAIQGLSAKLPSEEAIDQRIQKTLKIQEEAFQQWTQSLGAVFQQQPSREEFIRLVQTERHHQTEALQGLQHTLDRSLRHLPSREDLSHFLEDVHDLKNILRDIPGQIEAWGKEQSQGLRTGLLDGFAQQLQETTDQMATQFSQLEARILQERGSIDKTLQGLLATLSEVLQTSEEHTKLLQEHPTEEQTLGHVTHMVQEATHSAGEQIVTKVVEQVLSAKGSERQEITTALSNLMTRMEKELRQLQGQFHRDSDVLAKQLAGQSEALAAQSKVHAGVHIQGLADKLAEELTLTLQKLTEEQKKQLQEQGVQLEKRIQIDGAQQTGQVKTSLQEGLTDSTQKLREQIQEMEKVQIRSNQDMVKKVSDLLFNRLEDTFGTLTKGLSELRERFSSERSTIISTMELWKEDTSRSDQERTRQIDQKISEVVSQVNIHHDDLIRVIDLLSQNLNNDLDSMRHGLLSKNEENTHHVTQKVTDLGRVLENVINSVGQEQTVFIEMLGERLETLRRRLKTK